MSLLLLGAQPCVSSFISTLPAGAQDMFNESMTWLDSVYDPAAFYLYDVSQGTQTSLNHEVRASAWYAIGLLARNNGSDVDNAMQTIRNVVGGQFKNPADQWYALCAMTRRSAKKIPGTARIRSRPRSPRWAAPRTRPASTTAGTPIGAASWAAP